MGSIVIGTLQDLFIISLHIDVHVRGISMTDDGRWDSTGHLFFWGGGGGGNPSVSPLCIKH